PSLLDITLIFFLNYTAPTDIYTLSLHDALPIWIRQRYDADGHRDVFGWNLRAGRGDGDRCRRGGRGDAQPGDDGHDGAGDDRRQDRKSTRLNSSHVSISYAVFCLKKKKNDYYSE